VVGGHDFQLKQLVPSVKHSCLRYIAWAVKDLKKTLKLPNIQALVDGDFENVKSDLDESLINLVLHHLEETLQPKNFGMQITTSAGIKPGAPAREVWFEGKYLSIPVEQLTKFKEAVNSLITA
jgi:hypothetical protein